VRSARGQLACRAALARQVTEVHLRLVEAEETIRAIRTGEVDAVLTTGKQGTQVFTLEGAEDAYRLLIESMNEGALTLTTDKMILYANQCFAKMVKCPLKQVMGSSFRRYLSAEDRARLRALLRRTSRSGSKIQVGLHAVDGSQMPVQISIRPTATYKINNPTIGMVVTDLTEALRTEELLRALTHRVVKVQEDERGRVALELHDGITQLLCGLVFRCQILAEGLSAREGPAKSAAKEIRDIAGETVKEVERVAKNLRPSLLDQLGLAAALRDASKEFNVRTGTSIKLTCPRLKTRLSAEGELTLYRILQESLRNIERHARARNVSVELTHPDTFVKLLIKDDGVGFNPDQLHCNRKSNGGLGLLGMRERAKYVGGTLKLKSDRGCGTEIEVCIPTQSTERAND
jgi:PAS domain S-box-containing protein